MGFDWGILTIGVGLAVLVITLFYIGGPILIRFVFWYSTKPDIRPLDPDAISGDALAYLDGQARRLNELGFEEAGWLTLDGLVPNATVHFAVLTRPSERVMAMAGVLYGQDGDTMKEQSRYAEFCTEYPDGHSICTNNSDELVSAATLRDKTLLQLPQTRDTGELYRIHRALVRRTRPGTSPRPTPPPDAFTEELLHMVTRDVRYMTDAGNLFTRDGVTYRPTWTGAFRMTWELLWPITTLRRMNRTRKTERTLRSLAMS